MSSALRSHLAPMGKSPTPPARRLFPTILVSQVRCSNGDVISLRLLPEDALALRLNLSVALGELPPMPPEDEDDEGEA